MHIVLKLAAVALATVSSTLAANCPNVIVIGAGMAGIKAARDLTDACAQVTILEARNRTGGRLWSDRSLGFANDLGASWIHGPQPSSPDKPVNPITTLAQRIGVRTVPTDMSNLTRWHRNGAKYSGAEISAGDTDWANAKRAWRQYRNQQSDAGAQDGSWANFYTLANGNNYRLNADWNINYHVNTDTEFELGCAVESIGSFYSDGGSVYGYPPDWLIPDGYDLLTTYLISAAGSTLPAASARTLNITLQKEVTEIDYSTAGRCKVTCRDGSVYTADACVSTIPAGVMKHSPPAFKPALPQYKRDSLTRLKVGDDGGPNKVFLQYANKWWDGQNVKTFWGFDAGLTSETRGNWSYFVDFSGVTNRPVLLGFTLGRYSTTMESLTDAQNLAHIKERLQSLFPSLTVPDPTGFVFSKWITDPFTRGAYTAVGVSATNQDFTNLYTSLSKTLYFAGEATSAQHRGTVHGAFNTGKQAAADLMADANPKPSSAISLSMIMSMTVMLMSSVLTLMSQMF